MIRWTATSGYAGISATGDFQSWALSHKDEHYQLTKTSSDRWDLHISKSTWRQVFPTSYMKRLDSFIGSEQEAFEWAESLIFTPMALLTRHDIRHV